MAIRHVVQFDAHTGITTTSDTFVVDPTKRLGVAIVLTAGTPATGAVLEMTLDDTDKVLAETAAWVASPLGARTTSGAENILGPVTALRLTATDGTWTLQVRQA